MTVNATALATAPAPRWQTSPRRWLRVVDAPARRRRPKLMYGIVAVFGAVAIGAAQMTLSIMTTAELVRAVVARRASSAT